MVTISSSLRTLLMRMICASDLMKIEAHAVHIYSTCSLEMKLKRAIQTCAIIITGLNSEFTKYQPKVY